MFVELDGLSVLKTWIHSKSFLCHYIILPNDMVNNCKGEFNPNVASDASSHLTHILKFDFVVALIITRHVLDHSFCNVVAREKY